MVNFWKLCFQHILEWLVDVIGAVGHLPEEYKVLIILSFAKFCENLEHFRFAFRINPNKVS